MILPFVRALFADAERTPAYARVGGHLKSHAGRCCVSGLTETAKSLYLPLFQRTSGHKLIVIVRDGRAADRLLTEMRTFAALSECVAPESIMALPEYDVLPFEGLSPHAEIQEQRAATLWRMATGNAQIVIVPVVAACMKVGTAEQHKDLARVVRRGGTIDTDELTAHLNSVGYSPSDLVEMPGQYALRGGILDVYPPEAELPVRIEFFGDEVETLRRFDPRTQRSSSPMETALLLPLVETPVTDEVIEAVHARLSGKNIADARKSGEARIFPGWEHFAPVSFVKHGAGATQTVFDLWPDATVVVDESSDVRSAAEAWWQKLTSLHERSEVGNLVTPEDLYTSPDDMWLVVASRPGIDVSELSLGENDASNIMLASQPAPRFHGNMQFLTAELKKLTASGQRVLLCVANKGEAERLGDVLHEYSLGFRYGSRSGSKDTNLMDEGGTSGELDVPIIVRAGLAHGVSLPEARLTVFGAHDLFDESEIVAAPSQARKSNLGTFLSDFRDLVVGDYVVHVEHGIAQYLGLKEITQDGMATEFMLLEFAESAKLYVPLTRLDLIQKYRTLESGKPALSRMGGAAWAKTKARVKKAMQDMADELLKLYAERKAAKGFAYSADTHLQREFEDAFEFTETADQVTALEAIKKDMESGLPMDRLLCGDVGYGKTEVAMRAAFKAVCDNKQTAVLAPTTVLAFQHFETFKQRFASFPIKIEMVSRFRTAKEIKAVLEQAAEGKVDILIGTHRLLSKDVLFHDLGLVVVDEEQRFGVRHKERLKKMRKEVDVLTLSATPIPRTLHMSLVGMRDMSVIETPPKDRLAIQTVVAKFDDRLIKSAITHEIERGGQIYFLHNRVDTIYEIAAKLQEWVPQSRVLVGHGQMGEGELEKVMLKFMRHEADVLVATTIIENGLDIPLCNTILINRADRHGLSELYQLRGRVGRSDRRAYAYLLVPPQQELTPVARRRLAALQEFSDLGAGFKIAALDLELRGAGNLLGGQQSGHIEAVGFEMYTSMLEEAVSEMKGEKTEGEELHTQLNLALNLRIPNEYVTEENQRLRLYKRLAGAEEHSTLDAVMDEMTDRYGPVPASVKNLVDATRFKLMCQKVGVLHVDRKQNHVYIRFTDTATIDPALLMQYVAANKGAQFSPGGMLRIVLHSTAAEEVLTQLKDVLLRLQGDTDLSGQKTVSIRL